MEDIADTFSVMIDTAACSAVGRSSCMKSAQISYYNVTIDLVPQHPLKDTVTVHYSDTEKNGEKHLLMPVYDNQRGFVFRKLSTYLVEFVSNNGISVVWDGQTNLFATLSPRHSGKVQGLCGNFNFNTKDDFGIEDSPVRFGNKWKDSQSTCPDVTTQVGLTHCEMYQQNQNYAELQCSKLERAPFTACHSYVDPMPFVENCKQDVCACSGKQNCLCPVLEAYAQQCARHGLALDWRTNGTCCK